MAHILKGKLARGEPIDAAALDRIAELVDAPAEPVTDADRAWAAEAAQSIGAPRLMPSRDLFVQADADRFFAGLRGKPYRPSNGCEGGDFQDRWCAHCTRDAAFRRDPDSADGCSIIADTMTLDADDPDYPSEWRWNERGQPECSAFEAKPEANGDASPPSARDTTERQPGPRDDQQKDPSTLAREAGK